MIAESKIQEVVDKIAKGFNPEKIILFGSYAMGNATDDSDLDLMVIQETKLLIHKRANEMRFLLIGSKILIDILVFTKTEFKNESSKRYSFLHAAIKNSKTLYERP